MEERKWGRKRREGRGEGGEKGRREGGATEGERGGCVITKPP